MHNLVDSNNCDSFEFMEMVINEALRAKPAAGGSTFFSFMHDTNIGDYQFFKHDKIGFVFFFGLHYNTSQWQDPYEFKPERFDPQSPLFLTPDGKKRNPCSFMPFSAGQRVCLGKTFAEINLRLLSLHLTETFDFEYKNKEKYDGIDNYPLSMVFMNKVVPVEVNLTKRE